MTILRIFLFLGLLLHKAVWEVLKRPGATAAPKAPRQATTLKSVVKLVKVGVLLFLVVQTLFLDIFPISRDPQALRIAGVILYAAGLAIAILGRVELGRNWANLEDYQVLSGQSLVQTGIYRFIRHPIYTGDILLILGLELALNSWLVLGVIFLIAFVVRQTLAEEKILARAFPDYAAYIKQTKMFIPYLV